MVVDILSIIKVVQVASYFQMHIQFFVHIFKFEIYVIHFVNVNIQVSITLHA